MTSLITSAARIYRALNNSSWNALIEAEILLSKNKNLDHYERKVAALHKRLHIPHDFPGKALNIQKYPTNLYLLHQENKKFWMTEKTCNAWLKMKKAANEDGTSIHIKWAFRSIEQQAFFLRKQLAWGGCINDLITWIAPPGYSQHHSGKALDINTESNNKSFEDTDAFRWLNEHAKKFGFVMSFPKDNQYGVIYEPWHWYYEGK